MSISVFGTHSIEGGSCSCSEDSNISSRFVKKIGDKMLGVLSLGGNKIIDVSSPINPYDAANRKYVDQSKLLFASCNATSKNTTHWIRMFTITGTEGTSISLNVLEKNTGGNGALQAFVQINRTYNNSYSYVIFPWASGALHIAINYGEIWCKKNFSGITPLIANVSWFSNGETTTIKADGLTVSNSKPSGFIDTSQGSKLYIGPSTTIISGVTDPADAQDAATKKYVDDRGALNVNKAGDTMTGVLNMSNQRITNLPNPNEPNDAVSKSYVTSQIDAKDVTTKKYIDDHDALKVNKAGDIMTGVLNMNNQRITNLPNPSEPNDAVNKSYVTSQIDTRLNKGGDIMLGDLSMNHHKIVQVREPHDNFDAANKAYVDSKVISDRTMRGNINMNNHKITNLPAPEHNTDAATKYYVDLFKPKVSLYKIPNTISTSSIVTLTVLPVTGPRTETISLFPGIYRFTIAGTTLSNDDSSSRGDVEFWLRDEKVQRVAVKYRFQLVVILDRSASNSAISLKAKCTSSDPTAKPRELVALTLIVEKL